MKSSGFNMMAFTRGADKFVFVYPIDKPDEVIQQFGRLASDKSINFTWIDASLMALKVRKLAKEEMLKTKQKS